MTPTTKEAPPVAGPAGESEGMPLLLPPHLTENFEKAHRQIQEYYGLSPGVPALVRLWVACGTSTRIRMEFERAVLDITKRGLNPHEEAYFDDALRNFGQQLPERGPLPLATSRPADEWLGKNRRHHAQTE